MDSGKLFTETSIHLSSRQLCIITFMYKPADVYSTNVKLRCAETNVASISGNINAMWYQAGVKQLWRLSLVYSAACNSICSQKVIMFVRYNQ